MSGPAVLAIVAGLVFMAAVVWFTWTTRPPK